MQSEHNFNSNCLFFFNAKNQNNPEFKDGIYTILTKVV